MIKNLGESNSLFNQYVSELRDESVQKDRMRFRHNLKRIGQIAAYEISKELDYEEREIITPLGAAKASVPVSYPVVIPILRAGIPIHEGVLDYFDKSDSGFISAYRKVEKNKKFSIKIEYISSPDLSDRVVILCDPMLATGASVITAWNAILANGKPKHTHIVSAISSMESLDYIKKKLSSRKVTVWTGAIDEELTAQAYIVPGLGDAGDLAYGPKNKS